MPFARGVALKRVFCAAALAVSCIIFAVPKAHSLVFTRAVGDRSQFDNAAERVSRLFQSAHSTQSQSMPGNSSAAGPACMQWPVPGERITSVFGYRMHPIFHRRIFHEGLDFAASYGEKVHCVLDGKVNFSGHYGGFGNAVIVYHPTAHTYSLYGHMSKLLVHKGDNVCQGRIVGLAGSTGFSTGVHVHFGIKSEQGKWLDPLAFLHKVPGYELVALRLRQRTSGDGRPSGLTVSAASEVHPSVARNNGYAVVIPPENLQIDQWAERTKTAALAPHPDAASECVATAGDGIKRISITASSMQREAMPRVSKARELLLLAVSRETIERQFRGGS